MDSGTLIQVYIENTENVMIYIRTFTISYRDIKMHRAPSKVEMNSVVERELHIDLLTLEDVPVCLFCCEVTQSYRI